MFLHYTGGVWDTITTSHDLLNNEICGSTDGFSYFAMAVPKGASTLQSKLNQALFEMQGDGTLTLLVIEYTNLTQVSGVLP